MKRLITLLCCCLLLIIPFEANSEPPPPQPIFLQCMIAALIIGVGVVIIIGLKKMCQCLPPNHCTNRIDRAANTIELPPLLAASEGVAGESVGLESSESPEGPWHKACDFRFVNAANGLNVIAYINGAPVLTNTQAQMSVTNGVPFAQFDFTPLAPLLTNRGTFFRLAP